ncbi:MAG: amidohydrolase [Deltaproteobacteria bacterium]|nr:amidohydrolase [Deltaproteobacteria bacterium]
MHKWTFISFLALISFSIGAAQASPRADVVLHGGKVFTADTQGPWAEAVAIRGSRVLAVGSDAEVRALEGPNTLSLDLQGRLVVPGFNDAHTHLAVGLPRLTLPPINIPGPGPTLNEALAQVAGAVAIAEPGEWIVVTIGEAALFDPDTNRVALDSVAPDNPVLLFTWSSHTGVVNSLGIETLGLTETEADPFGGTYGRFPGTDVLNGVANEYGLFRIFREIRAQAPDELMIAQFEAFSPLLTQLGITSIQEMTVGLTRERSERVLAEADMAVRVRSMCVPLTPQESCRSRQRHPLRKVRSSGIKWLLDGTPVERSAALREPYADFPGDGVLNIPTGNLIRSLRRSLAEPPARNPILFHTVGDRAIDQALSAMESVAPAPVWRRRRVRLEHGDLLQQDHLARARRLGLIVVQNPTHLALDLAPALGPERAAAAQPLKTLLDNGVSLALASDGAFPNPFVDIFLAVFHPFHPEEALTVAEAVTAYTLGSATAEFQEKRKGSLRRGRLADLAVLSQDIFEIPPPAIPETVSLLTVVGGEIVWDSGALATQP